VYRSPDDDFYTFLRSLELTIQKVQLRNKWLILCGDWNVYFMQESVRLHHLQKLLLLHNLINTVRSPTRVTKNTISLIDVLTTNKDNHEKLAIVVDLDYSVHKALILHLNVNTVIRKHKKVESRHFTERSIEEFKCLFNKESWQEVFKASEVNATLQIFMDTFYYYFNIAFPCKSVSVSHTVANGLLKA
jgi:hypothetical protein